MREGRLGWQDSLCKDSGVVWMMFPHLLIPTCSVHLASKADTHWGIGLRSQVMLECVWFPEQTDWIFDLLPALPLSSMSWEHIKCPHIASRSAGSFSGHSIQRHILNRWKMPALSGKTKWFPKTWQGGRGKQPRPLCMSRALGATAAVRPG